MLVLQTHNLKASSAKSLPKFHARFHLNPQGQLFPPWIKFCLFMSLSEMQAFPHLCFPILSSSPLSGLRPIHQPVLLLLPFLQIFQ